MSLQSTETSTLGRVASRRNVIRGAAWSAGAVTIVVATPNIAAASPGQWKGTLTPATTSPVKYNNAQDSSIKHVKWDLTFKNTGTITLSALNIVCTFSEQSPAEITAFTVTPGAWSTSLPPTFTATYSGSVSPNGTLAFTPDFKGANNSKGTLTVAIYNSTTLLATIAGTWRPIGSA